MESIGKFVRALTEPTEEQKRLREAEETFDEVTGLLKAKMDAIPRRGYGTRAQMGGVGSFIGGDTTSHDGATFINKGDELVLVSYREDSYLRGYEGSAGMIGWYLYRPTGSASDTHIFLFTIGTASKTGRDGGVIETEHERFVFLTRPKGDPLDDIANRLILGRTDEPQSDFYNLPDSIEDSLYGISLERLGESRANSSELNNKTRVLTSLKKEIPNWVQWERK